MRSILILCSVVVVSLLFPVTRGSAHDQNVNDALAHKTKNEMLTFIQTDAFSPDVIILDPQPAQVTVNNEVLSFRALVLSPTIPLTSVTLTVNGKVLFTRKLEGEVGAKRRKFLTQNEISLRTGENVIVITATNEKAGPRRVIRRITFKPATTPSNPNLIVLSIGVSDSKEGRFKQPHASADAQAFAKFMAAQVRTQQLYGAIKTHVITDAEASRVGILKSLSWLNSEVNSDSDVRILFLSGAFGSDFSDGVYFLSFDHQPKTDPELSSVSLSAIFTRLAEARGPVLVFIDSNKFSSAAMRGALELIRRYSYERNFFIYLSSELNEAAQSPPTSDHSHFVTALLEGLKGQADFEMSGRKDGRIDTLELYFWLKSRVAALSGDSQHPVFLGNSKALPLFSAPAAQP